MMKRATGASFFVTLLVLTCFLQGGVGAVDTHRPVRSHYERTQDTHHETVTRTSNTIGENGRQHENSVQVVRVDDSANHQQHTRSGEKGTAPKIKETTHTTTAATRTEERSDWNTSHGRTSGNGVAVDDRTERTHHHSGGGTNERTHSGPHAPPTRASDVVEQGHSQTRDGTTTATSHSRTQSNGELYDRHDHTGEERTNIHEHPAPKTTSNRPLTEERSGGEEEEKAVQAKTKAHPIGLIHGLDGKVARGRSNELDAREMDVTTIIASSLIGFIIFILLLLLCCVVDVDKKRLDKNADTLIQVFQYLHQYNVDDIDIQVSAAGGLHVGYLNGLAQGINTKEQPDHKTDSSSDEGASGSLSKKV